MTWPPWDLAVVFAISCGWFLLMVEVGLEEGGAPKRRWRLVFGPALILYFLGLTTSLLLGGVGAGVDGAWAIATIFTFYIALFVVLAILAVNPFVSLGSYGRMPLGVVGGNFLLVLALFSAFAFRPTALLQLAGMLSIPSAGLAGLFLAVLGWKRTLLKTWAKFLVAGFSLVGPILAFLLAIDVGRAALCTYLRIYARDMEDVARRVSETKKPETWSGAPVQFREGVAMIWWGGGFPVRHTVFAWIPDPDKMDFSALRENWRVRPLLCAKGWYQLSD